MRWKSKTSDLTKSPDNASSEMSTLDKSAKSRAAAYIEASRDKAVLPPGRRTPERPKPEILPADTLANTLEDSLKQVHAVLEPRAKDEQLADEDILQVIEEAEDVVAEPISEKSEKKSSSQRDAKDKKKREKKEAADRKQAEKQAARDAQQAEKERKLAVVGERERQKKEAREREEQARAMAAADKQAAKDAKAQEQLDQKQAEEEAKVAALVTRDKKVKRQRELTKQKEEQAEARKQAAREQKERAKQEARKAKAARKKRKKNRKIVAPVVVADTLANEEAQSNVEAPVVEAPVVEAPVVEAPQTQDAETSQQENVVAEGMSASAEEISPKPRPKKPKPSRRERRRIKRARKARRKKAAKATSATAIPVSVSNSASTDTGSGGSGGGNVPPLLPTAEDEGPTPRQWLLGILAIFMIGTPFFMATFFLDGQPRLVARLILFALALGIMGYWTGRALSRHFAVFHPKHRLHNTGVAVLGNPFARAAVTLIFLASFAVLIPSNIGEHKEAPGKQAGVPKLITKPIEKVELTFGYPKTVDNIRYGAVQNKNPKALKSVAISSGAAPKGYHWVLFYLQATPINHAGEYLASGYILRMIDNKERVYLPDHGAGVNNAEKGYGRLCEQPFWTPAYLVPNNRTPARFELIPYNGSPKILQFNYPTPAQAAIETKRLNYERTHPDPKDEYAKTCLHQ